MIIKATIAFNECSNNDIHIAHRSNKNNKRYSKNDLPSEYLNIHSIHNPSPYFTFPYYKWCTNNKRYRDNDLPAQIMEPIRYIEFVKFTNIYYKKYNTNYRYNGYSYMEIVDDNRKKTRKKIKNHWTYVNFNKHKIYKSKRSLKFIYGICFKLLKTKMV